MGFVEFKGSGGRNIRIADDLITPLRWCDKCEEYRGADGGISIVIHAPASAQDVEPEEVMWVCSHCR